MAVGLRGSQFSMPRGDGYSAELSDWETALLDDLRTKQRELSHAAEERHNLQTRLHLRESALAAARRDADELREALAEERKRAKHSHEQATHWSVEAQQLRSEVQRVQAELRQEAASRDELQRELLDVSEKASRGDSDRAALEANWNRYLEQALKELEARNRKIQVLQKHYKRVKSERDRLRSVSAPETSEMDSHFRQEVEREKIATLSAEIVRLQEASRSAVDAETRCEHARERLLVLCAHHGAETPPPPCSLEEVVEFVARCLREAGVCFNELMAQASSEPSGLLSAHPSLRAAKRTLRGSTDRLQQEISHMSAQLAACAEREQGLHEEIRASGLAAEQRVHALEEALHNSEQTRETCETRIEELQRGERASQSALREAQEAVAALQASNAELLDERNKFKELSERERPTEVHSDVLLTGAEAELRDLRKRLEKCAKSEADYTAKIGSLETELQKMRDTRKSARFEPESPPFQQVKSPLATRQHSLVEVCTAGMATVAQQVRSPIVTRQHSRELDGCCTTGTNTNTAILTPLSDQTQGRFCADGHLRAPLCPRFSSYADRFLARRYLAKWIRWYAHQRECDRTDLAWVCVDLCSLRGKWGAAAAYAFKFFTTLLGRAVTRQQERSSRLQDQLLRLDESNAQLKQQYDALSLQRALGSSENCASSLVGAEEFAALRRLSDSDKRVVDIVRKLRDEISSATEEHSSTVTLLQTRRLSTSAAEERAKLLETEVGSLQKVLRDKEGECMAGQSAGTWAREMLSKEQESNRKLKQQVSELRSLLDEQRGIALQATAQQGYGSHQAQKQTLAMLKQYLTAVRTCRQVSNKYEHALETLKQLQGQAQD